MGVLAYIIHLRCFTEYVTDTDARYSAGISQICVITLQIAFSVLFLLRDFTHKAILNGKKYWNRLRQ